MFEFVRDVSTENKDVFYVVLKDERKIFKIVDMGTIKLLKKLNIAYRWYDEELSKMLSRGYVLVENLEDL